MGRDDRRGEPPRITVFTPTFQRAPTIHRVYESLCAQTVRDFEWIVVDDGSTDHTGELVESFISQAAFPIIYLHQEHSGKHCAWNNAVSHAHGLFFIVADSDDGFIPTSFERLLSAWESIPACKRGEYAGCSCRCRLQDGSVVGDVDVPEPYLDATESDAKYIHRLRFELWGMMRTDVMRAHPYPEPKGLRFYPETILWDEIAKNHKIRYINDALRVIYHDQGNSVTAYGSAGRSRENYYLWLHLLNDMISYFRYDPLQFLKAAVGIIRDGRLNGKPVPDILDDIEPFHSKALALLGILPGLALCKLAQRER